LAVRYECKRYIKLEKMGIGTGDEGSKAGAQAPGIYGKWWCLLLPAL
jgi:hypothetical protein